MQSTSSDVLPEIVRRLVAEFDPEGIILFGSRAWGQPRPDSDYDLFVIVSESKEHPAQRAFRAHDSLSGLGISKDVLVSTKERFDRFSRVPAALEAKIHDRGVVLYGRSHPGDIMEPNYQEFSEALDDAINIVDEVVRHLPPDVHPEGQKGGVGGPTEPDRNERSS